MYLIGLTGGIASGKSVVAKRLAEHGAVHVDADQLAREVVEPGAPTLERVREAFGPQVLTPDGGLDRPALGAIVFSDPDARERLNAIMHPAVWELAAQRFAAAGPDDVVVYDVPLLVEAAQSRPMTFDLVVVVHASRQTRLNRLVELRGLTPQEAQQRISSQASDKERLAVADVIIDADGTLEDTIRQTDELWARASAAARS